MITNHIAKTLKLGLWIAVGTFGCSSAPNNAAPGSTSNTGGTVSDTSSSSTGGSSSRPESSPTGGATQSATSGVDQTGGATGAGTSAKANGGTAGGGKTGVGGTTSAGGAKTATGGTSSNAGTGGARPSGGTSGSTGGTNAVATTASTQTGNCSITQKSGTVSSTIGPVGIVTFTVSGASSLDSAEIQFGSDTSYGLSAPVDVSTASSDYRTLLLGMKAGKAYHYQIVGKSGGATCKSPDYTITAGGCPTSIKKPTISTTSGVSKSQLDGGFLVLEGYKATTPDDYAYILDGDGDVVWCYKPSGFSDLTATRMSWDGKYMWLVHGNVPSGTAHMGRVSMDGAEFKDYSSEFSGLNHDATVLPNDKGVAYIAYSSNGCDDVKLWKPSGGSSTIINSGTIFGTSGGGCHCNAIKYDESDDSVIVSDDDHSGYFKVGLDGKVIWVLGGGSANQFDKSGGGASKWTGQHNFHILGNDSSGQYHFLFFNNGVSASGGGGVSSVARELTLDIAGKTTKEIWKYEANPAIANQVMGDVQRLENGNTMIAYSLVGKILEVDSKGTLLQSLTWGGGGSGIGYITKRRTLYGAPPKAR